MTRRGAVRSLIPFIIVFEIRSWNSELVDISGAFDLRDEDRSSLLEVGSKGHPEYRFMIKRLDGEAHELFDRDGILLDTSKHPTGVDDRAIVERK